MGAAGEDREETLRRYAGELADAVDEAIPRWVERVVLTVLDAQGIPVDATVRARLEEAAAAARAAGAPRVRALLELDIDEQRTTPLALLRDLVRFPTEVLRSAGARPVPRDDFRQRSFPDDVYDLTPASFAEVDEALHEPGLAWGAAKAYVHLGRHGPKGGASSS